MGYRRPDGSVGTRNYLIILPSVFCANTTAEKIAAQIPGAVAMPHCVGCSQVGLDLELTARTLKAMGCHPNAGAVIVIGLGCERFNPQELYDAVKATGKPVAKFVIQEEGGVTKTVERAVAVGRQFAAELAGQKRVPCALRELMVATKCGGTDATSGLAANPAVGSMVDKVVAEAHETGYVTTMFGRRRELPAIKARMVEKKLFVECEADLAPELVRAGADGIQLDKVAPEAIPALLGELRAINPSVTAIAAGGVNPSNVAAYAATGIDGIVTTAPFTAKPVDMSVRMHRL